MPPRWCARRSNSSSVSTPRWLRHDGPGYDRGWDGDGRPGTQARTDRDRPDLIVYNCLGERRPLEFAVARLRPFGTLKLVGAGPACTLVEPLRLEKPIRISGDKDATLLGPPGGPCLIVPPQEPGHRRGQAALLVGRRYALHRGGRRRCEPGAAGDPDPRHRASAKGGRLSLREVHLSGGPAPVLRLQHAEFAIIKVSIESYGDGAEIIPPPEGIAQIDKAEFNALGRHGVGLVLRAEGPPGARVVLDDVKLEDFVAGLKAGPGTRSVATHLHVGHAGEVGVEAAGSGLDLSNSVIEAGEVGVRLTGYLPGAPGDAPRILDNEIRARSGVFVTDTPAKCATTPSAWRRAAASSASAVLAISASANLCHPP